MTGKELKEFAAKVPDEAVIAVRERSYGAFEQRFEIQAALTLTFQKKNQSMPSDEHAERECGTGGRMDAKDSMIMDETRRMMELEVAKAEASRYRTIMKAQEELIAQYRELVTILKQGHHA